MTTTPEQPEVRRSPDGKLVAYSRSLRHGLWRCSNGYDVEPEEIADWVPLAPAVSPVPDADGLRDLIHSCAQRGIKDWDRDYDSRAAGPVTDYVMGALHYVFGRWEASLRAEVERLRGENAELDAARWRLRRELDRVSAEATLNTIPDDAAERITAKLCHLGVVDPDDDTMPVFMDVEDQEASGGRIDHWVHVDGVAEELLKAVRSWLSTPATDHAPAVDHAEYCAGLTWTVRHVPPGTTDPEDTDEPIRPGWWVLGVDPEDPELPVVQVWLGDTLAGTDPAPAAGRTREQDEAEVFRLIDVHAPSLDEFGREDLANDLMQLFHPDGPGCWAEDEERPAAPQAPAEPEPCGQVHGGEVCTKPRVPTTNGCWGHYGPEPDPDAQYACDPAHHVAGQEPCPHCKPIPGRPQAPAEPMASCGIHTEAEAQTSIRHELCTPAEPTTWTEHDVEVLHQDDGWATAQCHTCGASIGESIEDDVEDWVDQHRADTLRPAGEEQ